MQSRLLSLTEAAVNVAIGFIVALLTQMALFSALGLRVSMDRHLLIGTVFTLVSLARSYLVRRFFERYGRGRG
ncbi:hypothetical protein SAMN04488020_102145 [Palleronia marisminoris]|uniref:Uncharacterized protein n=1 Tax=Palleronia marisminoris TaxID=315423 RepID=A0A1Y5RYZ3_9RHOB|nr:hypothetical protein [Palleronia marisminoris]SFG41015.1 hypothetical protein SAMN04488020_102145 [Palleronia marisminoris]SLN28493.1 hypothetical protein PAM7066_01135 [Palleronia marisminoris]